MVSRPTIIRISKANIEGNRRRRDRAPVVTVWFPDGRVESGFGAEIKGPCRLVYAPDRDDPSGGVWIETEAEVELLEVNDVR